MWSSIWEQYWCSTGDSSGAALGAILGQYWGSTEAVLGKYSGEVLGDSIGESCMVWCFFDIVHSSLFTRIRYSLAGQDTRLSPERPGFESRWRNSLPIAPARQLVAAPLWSLSQPIDTALYDEFWQRQGKNNFKKKICATGRQ